MTVALAPPLPLPDPPGAAGALGAVVDRLGSAGFAAGLAVHRVSPATEVSGWQGADAVVTAAEVGAALAVAADQHGALTTARSRLADHLDLWLTVAARVTQLREEQRARFAAAGARLALLAGPSAEVGGRVPAEGLTLVRTVAAEDAATAAEHRVLLQTLADDASGAAAVLTTALQPFGDGRPGAAALVTARLAVRLPGWGEGALAALGREAGDELTRAVGAGALADAVQRWRPHAALPGFGEALVGRLGVDGVTWLLSVLGGEAGTAETEALAGLLAGVLGGAASAPGTRGAGVLDRVRLDPTDPDPAVDRIALAMGQVLGARGAGSALPARWGGQLLAREAARGTRAGAGTTGGALLADPVGAAVAAVARSGDHAAAAALLAGPAAWTTLLSRPWPRGTGSLAAVVSLAAAAPDADRVARSALLALGGGLRPDSSGRAPDGEEALSAVRDEVAGLVAERPGVVLSLLEVAGTSGDLDHDADTALRGLGRLVSEAAPAERVGAAVRAALQSGPAGSSAGHVAGAFVAVQDYGQRLRYALSWSRAQSRAVDAAILWTFAVRVPLTAVPGALGEVAGAVEGPVADGLDVNGDVEIGADRGIVRTADDAARFAVESVGPAAAGGARAGFDRAGGVLGRLAAPEETFLDRLDDLPVADLARSSRRGG